jgi:outer membrane protein TolC
MKYNIQNIIVLICLPLYIAAQKELKFNNIDSLFSFAEKSSSVIKTNNQQTLLAKYQKIAAIANVVNFRDPVSFSLTDNTLLPVSFIPADLLGGPPGTFREITLGQQYVSNLSITPQIDIINPNTWAQIKSARINVEITGVNNQLNKKSLYQSIAACYFNISTFLEQIKLAQNNIYLTDTLLMIISDKFLQGQVRQQDVNDATVNKLTLQDKLKQLQVSLEQQCNSLKILCDIPPNTTIRIEEELNYNQTFAPELKANSQLLLRSAMLQAEYAGADLRMNRLSNLPVFSLMYNNSFYQNSNNEFFDNNPNNKWLNSVYFGAKVTFFLPDVNRIILTQNSKINYQIALINLDHNKLQDDINNNQLQLDYEKAYSQFFMFRQVSSLKEENYKMALHQYNQSILSFDKLLTAFNDMVNSRMNYSSAIANLLYTKSEVEINNTLK